MLNQVDIPLVLLIIIRAMVFTLAIYALLKYIEKHPPKNKQLYEQLWVKNSKQITFITKHIFLLFLFFLIISFFVWFIFLK